MLAPDLVTQVGAECAAARLVAVQAEEETAGAQVVGMDLG